MSGGDGDGGDVDTRRGEKENVEVPVPNLVPEDTGGELGGVVGQREREAGEDKTGGWRGGAEEEIEGRQEQGGGVARAGGRGE